MQELADIVISNQAFGHTTVGLANSIMPHDPVRTWGIFSLNTLHRLREQLEGYSPSR